VLPVRNSQALHHLLARDSDGRVSGKFVLAFSGLAAQPSLQRGVAGLERAQTVANDFAFTRIFAGGDLPAKDCG
jgi:hypothetical protein